jgi:DNA-directed RNA polymerase subunit RPC12/RpoP
MSIKIVSREQAKAANKKTHPIQKIFQLGWPQYQKDYAGHITSEQYKAADCISKCRTEAMGYNKVECPRCGYTEMALVKNRVDGFHTTTSMVNSRRDNVR